MRTGSHFTDPRKFTSGVPRSAVLDCLPPEIFQVVRIIGEIFGQTFHRAGNVACQIVARDSACCRLLDRFLLETFTYVVRFRHSSWSSRLS